MALPPMLPRRIALATSSMAGVSLASWKAAIAQPAFSAGAEAEPGVQRELKEVLDQAVGLGVAGPQAASAREAGALDVARSILEALEKGPESEDAGNFAVRAGLILSEMIRDRRDGYDNTPGAPAPAIERYPYSPALGKEYIELFTKAKMMPADLPTLRKVSAFILSDQSKSIYKQVETATGVPWYVVGALHYREADLNFMGHLHNGDPLLLRTVHVPALRPSKPWIPSGVEDPRILWQLSARDALQGLSSRISIWNIGRMCYGFESYNGFGCRGYGIRSPYLWNYTNWYSRGGFPEDHKFVSTYVSKQAGVMAMVAMLHQTNSHEITPEIEV